MALERPWIEKQIVSEPSLKKMVSFRPLWNQSETTRLVSDWFQTTFYLETGFGEGRIRQNELWAQIWAHQNCKKRQFLTLDSRIPAEGCFEHEKIAKNLQFLTFFGDFCSFFPLSKKRPYKAKRIVSTIPRTLSSTPKTQKKHSFWHSTLVFLWEGCTGHTKTRKKPQFLTLDSRIPAESCSKNSKIAKTLSFWHSTRTFPERGCAGHVFRDYWVALN